MSTVSDAARRERRSLWRVFVIILACLVGLALLLFIGSLLVTGPMVRKQAAGLQASGYLVPIERLVPQVPPGEPNAADVYEQAFRARVVSQDDEDKLSEGPVSDDPRRMAVARRVIAANSEYYRLLEDASRLPYCSFAVDWGGDPASMIFPHWAKVREAARMLQMRALVRSAEGRVDEAVRDCGTMLRMAEHAKLEPTLIAQLVAYAIQGMATQTLEDVLSKGAPTLEACRQLSSQMALIEQTEPSVRAMKGEAALSLRTFKEGRGAPFLRAYRTVVRPLADLDEQSYLAAMKRNIDAFGLPWPESREAVQSSAEEVDGLPRYRSVLTKMVLPVFGRALESRESKTAQIGAARIALALIIYKLQRGAYPDSLPVLEKAGLRLPDDPFTHQPYQYRRDGAGFLVYSLGPDMQDDGGRPLDYAALRGMPQEQRQRALEHYDIPFRVSR